mgnify:FL=1
MVLSQKDLLADHVKTQNKDETRSECYVSLFGLYVL